MFSMEKESERRNTFRVKGRKNKQTFKANGTNSGSDRKSQHTVYHVTSVPSFLPQIHFDVAKNEVFIKVNIFFPMRQSTLIFTITSQLSHYYLLFWHLYCEHIFIVVPLIAHSVAKIICYWFSPLRTWGSPSCFPSRKASVFSARFYPQIILILTTMLLFTMSRG